MTYRLLKYAQYKSDRDLDGYKIVSRKGKKINTSLLSWNMRGYKAFYDKRTTYRTQPCAVLLLNYKGESGANLSLRFRGETSVTFVKAKVKSN